METSIDPIWFCRNDRFGSAAVSRNSFAEWRKTTPSSSTYPASSHQIVYCARPGRQVRMSRAKTPARNASASRPVISYLKRGEASKKPTALRTPKYSCLPAMSYWVAERWPAQCCPQLGGVELGKARVKRRGLDHAGDLLRLHRRLAGRGRSASGAARSSALRLSLR